jgi:hypothetical protein
MGVRYFPLLLWKKVAISLKCDYTRQSMADKTLKISPEADDELARLANEYGFGKGNLADAMLTYVMAELPRLKAALDERIHAGSEQAEKRRKRTTPIRASSSEQRRLSGQ